MNTKKFIITLLTCTLLTSCTRVNDIQTQKKEEVIEEKVDDLQTLQNQINDYVRANGLEPEMISYTIQDLETNVTIGSENKAENFIAGSVYKLPLSMLWYDRINSGMVSEDTPLQYTSICQEEGGPIYENYSVGDYLTLSQVLYYVLLFSDNVGGHILFENIGGWQTYKSLAANYSQHPQNEEFFSMENYLNSEYMCDVMKQIYDHQEEYKDVIEYLKEASPEDYLNHTIQVEMIQKVGWCDNFVNACGLSLNGHPYIFCIFTAYNNYGLTVMGDINKIVYEYFN